MGSGCIFIPIDNKRSDASTLPLSNSYWIRICNNSATDLPCSGIRESGVWNGKEMNRWLQKCLRLVATWVVFWLSTNAFSDVSYTPAIKIEAGSFVVSKIRIYNNIHQGDAKQFHALVIAAKERNKAIGLNSVDGMPLMVILDSTGGSVNDSIAIGQEIRSINPFTVNVDKGSVCVSACVFILAGAPSKRVEGLVGIHRPYYEFDSALTPGAQKQQYSAMEKRIKHYLESVNVPTGLYDTMFRIPPEQMRYLTFKEMQDYNLNEDDPYYKESRDAQWAHRIGISKTEYASRKSACYRLPNDQATKECLNKLHTEKQ